MKKRYHPSRAYNTFELVAKRSLNLLSLQKGIDEHQAESARRLDLSDLSRAAVVIAVSGMDAYFADVFAEHVVRYLKTHRADDRLIALLSKAGFDSRLALEWFPLQQRYRKVRLLVETYLRNRTFNRLEVIDKLFLCFSIDDLSKSAQGATGRRSLRRSIKTLVDRRNRIAHEGDMNSRNRLHAIDRAGVRRHVGNMVHFIASCDKLIWRVVS